MYSSGLKGLQKVSFEHLRWYKATLGEDLQRPLPSGCVIQKVKLEGETFVAFTDWLLPQTVPPSVLSFGSRAFDTVTHVTWKTFLEYFGESITSLLVYFKEEATRGDANGSVESLGST